jgi:hypothetical protein
VAGASNGAAIVDFDRVPFEQLASFLQTQAGGVVLGAAISGLFIIVGQWINRGGASAAARTTIEGQRLLARDQAIRQWRIDQVIQPLLTDAHARRSIYFNLLSAGDQMLMSATEPEREHWFGEIARFYRTYQRKQGRKLRVPCRR